MYINGLHNRFSICTQKLASLVNNYLQSQSFAAVLLDRFTHYSASGLVSRIDILQ